MKCVICKNGQTRAGSTTITLERGNLTLVVKGVPAQVCDNCGEAYTSEEISQDLLGLAEEAASNGIQVDVREYQAA